MGCSPLRAADPLSWVALLLVPSARLRADAAPRALPSSDPARARRTTLVGPEPFLAQAGGSSRWSPGDRLAAASACGRSSPRLVGAGGWARPARLGSRREHSGRAMLSHGSPARRARPASSAGGAARPRRFACSSMGVIAMYGVRPRLRVLHRLQVERGRLTRGGPGARPSPQRDESASFGTAGLGYGDAARPRRRPRILAAERERRQLGRAPPSCWRS